jgi:spermidine/putrescine transport system substrate-binding protein
MMMPAEVEHPYAAETMMNYCYEPEVAAKIAAYVNYISPVKGIEDVLSQDKETAELVKSPLIFPSDEVRSRLHPYPALSPKDEQTMQEAMAKVTGA